MWHGNEERGGNLLPGRIGFAKTTLLALYEHIKFDFPQGGTNLPVILFSKMFDYKLIKLNETKKLPAFHIFFI